MKRSLKPLCIAWFSSGGGDGVYLLMEGEFHAIVGNGEATGGQSPCGHHQTTREKELEEGGKDIARLPLILSQDRKKFRRAKLA